MSEALIAAARAVREHAHAPYSNFRVGAALEDFQGKVFTGCNVENATFGLTICAERVAVVKAISDGIRGFRRIAVVTDSERLTPPCGACRQILWEFCGDVELILANTQGRVETLHLGAIFPRAFDGSFFSFFLIATGLLAAQSVDWIVTAHYVVTVDALHRIIENGAIAITGDHIVAVGTRTEIEKQYRPKRRLDRPDAAIAPGLVDTHTHAAMSLFRGIADDLRLQDWLNNFIFPAEAKNVSADFVRWGTRLACLEMLLSGTTTFTDMYYFEDVVAEVAKEAGMRGVLGETVIGFPVADAKTPEEALKLSEKFLMRFKNDPLVTPAVAPHALYTNSPETLTAARKLANRFDAPILIHLAETKQENDDAKTKYGKTATQFLDSIGFFDGRTVAAHGVWLDADDIAVLKTHNTGVAHCPSSNMKLASGAAPITKMLAAGINVGLGPDGPAGSNNDFNMFEEMDLAAKLQKLVTMDPQALPARTAIEMATIGGARVLGLEKRIGSLEAGKRADLITISLDAPNALPLYGIESQIVYALKGSDVRDVFVNGKLVVKNRVVLTLNTAEIKLKAQAYRKQVSASLNKR